MKHVVIATILAVCAGSSFSKGVSPACAALQNAKEAQASGKPFEQYRIVTQEGEQVIATPEQAIGLWGPRCQQAQTSSGAKLVTKGKAVAQKAGQASPVDGG